MKKGIFSVLFSLFCFAAIAQTTEEYYLPSKPKVQLKDRISGSVMAGTSVSFLNGSKTAGFATYIAPKVNYSLSEKFSLTAGLIHYSLSPGTAYPLNRNESLYNSGKHNASANLFFAGGEYRLNKKVTLSGAVMADMKGMNNRQNNYRAVSAGMDYKVSKHSSIGFRATVSQGASDYNYDPKRGSYEYIPLHDSFGNIFTGLGQWGVDELNRSIR